MQRMMQIQNKKTLKLTNVLVDNIIDANNRDIEKKIANVENYIKLKSASPLGPIIQHIETYVDAKGELKARMRLLRQVDKYIDNIDEPLEMIECILVKNCLFLRYQGPEDKMNLAYQKLNVIAFEKDLKLKSENYTVLVDRQNDGVIADIFIPYISYQKCQ